MIDLTESELAEIEARANAAFKGPWRYTSFEIDCGYDDCASDGCRADPDKHQGYEHEVVEVDSPDEYPDGQCVVQIHVPGLEQFAHANGEFIAAARTDVPRLVAAVRARDATIEKLETEAEHYRYVIRSLQSKFAQIAETCAKIGADPKRKRKRK